jgi:proteasome lid subunit RPN8/RPN11
VQQLNLDRSHWDAMRTHVESCAPFEACGLLAGQGDRVREVVFIANQLQSPTAFRMAPAEQVRAFRRMDDEGMELVGIFHSHPAPPGTFPAVNEEPSATDMAEAAYDVVQIIWSRPRGQWQARGFRIEDRTFSEVTLLVADAQHPSGV